MRLFRRKISLIVEDIKIEGFAGETLDVEFLVEKSMKPEPNVCDLAIWNLNESNQNSLLAKKFPSVVLEAGYEEGSSQLYLGQVRRVYVVRDGPDTITKLETADSEKKYASARINIPVGPKTPVDTVFRACARALGVKEGNLFKVVNDLKFKGTTTLHPQGGALSGPASKQMTYLAKSAGLEWSIQDGNLQFVSRNDSIKGTAVVLSSETGLVGAPSLDAKGVLTCTALLQPDIVPGRLLVLRSPSVSGSFRVERVQYQGSTFGTEWYAVIEGKSVGVDL